MKGTEESASVNAVIVGIKVTIVLVFIAFGFQFINKANYTPYMIPEGFDGHVEWNKWGYGGVLGGAAIVFFCVYWLRCGLNGGARSEESCERYAYRYPRLVSDLYRSLCSFCPCFNRRCELDRI